jgi:hypothetical protein
MRRAQVDVGVSIFNAEAGVQILCTSTHGTPKAAPSRSRVVRIGDTSTKNDGICTHSCIGCDAGSSAGATGLSKACMNPIESAGT